MIAKFIGWIEGMDMKWVEEQLHKKGLYNEFSEKGGLLWNNLVNLFRTHFQILV
jgi:hypothetical protein